MKRLFPFFSCLSAVILMSCAGMMRKPDARRPVVHLIPQPVQIQYLDSEFTIDSNTSIESANPDLEGIRAYLSEFLGLHLKLGLKSGPRGSGKNIRLRIDPSVTHEEGYVLRVDGKGVTVSGRKPAGVFYGVQTLLQLIQQNQKEGSSGEFLIPGVLITDQPRFPWRGMHLDVCRHFFPKEFVKRYIDLLAMHKMNVFHWHLTEDQGWRIEIKRYPKLTEIGAWRVDRSGVKWDQRKRAEPGENAGYGGYYTQDDVREVVAYAASRFVTVVPEIEMPGHAVAALAAYPQYSCTGGPFSVMTGGYWPITDIFCAGNDSTFIFLENILSEVIDLFPGIYVHIGGDEAAKDNWKKCPKCQERIRAHGLKDEGELQSYFIKRIEKFIASKGRRLIGWDEILEGGLPEEATVMSWRGMQGGITAASEGHDVVMTPTDYCYFDYYQAKEGEPPGIGGFLPLEKVYGFEPVPGELDADKQKHILGAQGNLWTEYIPEPKHAEYMALPRMCGLSEVVWSPKDARDWTDFRNRLNTHFRLLDLLNVNYRRPAAE
ncbi:beta-N-acetylhexosaminidase [bacterium]|nr:beta-N-acetylhexosaminidase [bacterium]